MKHFKLKFITKYFKSFKLQFLIQYLQTQNGISLLVSDPAKGSHSLPLEPHGLPNPCWHMFIYNSTYPKIACYNLGRVTYLYIRINLAQSQEPLGMGMGWVRGELSYTHIHIHFRKSHRYPYPYPLGIEN